MNQARDLKVIGVETRSQSPLLCQLFHHLENRIGPILRALATMTHTKNVQAFVVWLTLIAQQRQTTSW